MENEWQKRERKNPKRREENEREREKSYMPRNYNFREEILSQVRARDSEDKTLKVLVPSRTVGRLCTVLWTIRIFVLFPILIRFHG